MNTSRTPDLYVELEGCLLPSDGDTADCIHTEGKILNALGVNDEEGVFIDFDILNNIACIRGLAGDDYRTITASEAHTYNEGNGRNGCVVLIPDPEAAGDDEEVLVLVDDESA